MEHRMFSKSLCKSRKVLYRNIMESFSDSFPNYISSLFITLKPPSVYSLFFLLLIALIVWPQMDGALMMMSHIISVGHLALFKGLFDNLIHLQNHKSLILSRHSLEMKLLSQRHSGGTAFSHDEWSSINSRSRSLVFSFFLSHEVTFY